MRSDTLAASLEDVAPRRARGAFMAGFATVSLIVLAGVGIYLRSDAIVAAAPGFAEPLERFIALVDEARAALAAAVGRGE